MKARSNRTYWTTILVVTLFFSLATFAQIQMYGTEEESIRILIRSSARLSALLFSFAFSAGAIHYFFKMKWSAWLLSIRPMLGLAFTVSHTFHLFFLIWMQKATHPVFSLAKSSSLIAGGIAYLFMYLMAITTFKPFRMRLSPNSWKWLHLMGGYWIWGIFFNSYLKNVLNRERYHYLLIILSLVLILRAVQLIYSRGSMARYKSS